MDLVRHILSGEGPIARALGGGAGGGMGAGGAGYEARPEQVEMALAVARAFEATSHLLVEAGTGVGKSFAYLVPAIIRCVAFGERVVIATNTIALQEQLIEKDVPLLASTLEAGGAGEAKAGAPRWGGAGALRPVLVKGRGNYVSIRRLQLASQRQDRLFAETAARRTLHTIEDWAATTLDGTLATLPQLERPGVWDRVRSDSGNCMGKRCPQHEACFYQSSRRAMESANLLICNHALFFSDLALRARDVGFLPTYQHVVLDEAHNVEDVASDHFGLSLAEGRVAHLLSLLFHSRSGKGYLPHLELIAGDTGLVNAAVRAVAGAEGAMRAFFDSLLHARRGLPGTSGRVRGPGIVENTLTPAMRELSLRLKALREGVKNEADRFELNAYALRAGEIAEAGAALVEQSMSGCVYWIEVSSDGSDGSDGGGGGGGGGGFGRQRVTLACSPIEVGPLLKERLFGRAHSVVLTSATMATGPAQAPTRGRAGAAAREGDGFAHAVSRLGCEGAATLLLGSPFDHASQVELHIDPTMPSPRSTRGGGAMGGAGGPSSLAGGHYLDGLAARILEHVRATDGGAFVLFTSFSALNAAADALRWALEELGMPLLVQGRSGARGALLKQFRENERSVLFGAASFWQGVDVRGRGLRNVIITRLPFDPPDRPLTEARCEAIKGRGGDPFREESLPRAVLRFKQGFGRLIRSKADRGRVVVLDPRIVTAGYGKRFLEALPANVPVIMPRKSSSGMNDHTDPSAG